jgi:hypothetical protein
LTDPAWYKVLCLPPPSLPVIQFCCSPSSLLFSSSTCHHPGWLFFYCSSACHRPRCLLFILACHKTSLLFSPVQPAASSLSFL